MALTVTEMERRNHTRLIFMATLFSLLVVTPGLAGATKAAAKVDLKPGEYDFTVTYEIQGEQSARSKTVARCITSDELNSPEEIFSDSAPVNGKATEPCKVKNLKDTGEKISYDADCSNRLVHVQGTVKQTEFLVVRNVKPKASSGVSLKLMLRGRRTGSCRIEDKAAKP